MSWLSKAKSAASGAVKAGVAAGSAVAAASASAADAINAKLEKDESTGLVPEPPQDLEGELGAARGRACYASSHLCAAKASPPAPVPRIPQWSPFLRLPTVINTMT